MAEEDRKVKFKVEIDPTSKQAVVRDLRELGNVQQELLAFFSTQARQGLDYYTVLLEKLKESSKGSDDFLQVLGKVQLSFQDVSKEIQPIINYLLVAEKEGKSLNQTIEELEGNFLTVSTEAGKLTDILNHASAIMQQIGATDIASSIRAGKKGADSLVDAFKGLAAGGPVGTAIGGILTGIMSIVKSTEPLRQYMADVNRSIFDINAALGNAGQLSSDLEQSTAGLISKYKLSGDEVFKLEKGLADIGVRQEEVSSVADNILAQYTMWKDISPEKQIQIMEQNMHKFGASAKDAQAAMFGLFKNADDVAKSVQNLSAKDFIDQAQQLALSTRQWGYNLGDAQAMLSSMVGLMTDAKTKTVDIDAATQATRGIMGMGMGNLSMQAFMMERFGGQPGQGPAAAIGRFITGTEGEKIGPQLAALKEFITAAGGGKIPGSKEEIAGAIAIANQQLGLGLGDERTIAKLATTLTPGGGGITGWEKFEKTTTDAAKKAEDQRKTQEDANKKIGENLGKIADVIPATTTFEQRSLAELQAVGLNTKGTLEALLFPDTQALKQEFEMRSQFEQVKDPEQRKKILEILKEREKERLSEAGIHGGGGFTAAGVKIKSSEEKLLEHHLEFFEKMHNSLEAISFHTKETKDHIKAKTKSSKSG